MYIISNFTKLEFATLNISGKNDLSWILDTEIHLDAKRNQNEIKQQENSRSLQNKPPKGHERVCYWCGIKGHWSHTYRTPKYLAELYQASLKEKGKGVKVNLTELGDPKDYLDASDGVNITHLEAFDFFRDINREAQNLIGDQNDHTY